ncbi:hypothetical protein SAMN02745181_0842 [Rubritalea squalenifaciens DSM 18772]|uniref:Uncharacterized protein n=2 Tax=Rubritalea TaxID=361050 RepID=A0A1M6DV64_9BACT|nr:hypothetical protein [Rubritalea squalenifaciens]SHI77121.1 hypothetical protein SAMN02745181_0842 [Rubritalea squalenifaciens DSM 18772]
MQMRFTDEEMLTLAEMLSLACWVSSFNQLPGSDFNAERYEAMLDRVLERLSQLGMGKLIEHDPNSDRPRLTKEFEEKSYAFQSYDEMRNATFWEDLMIRLAERDMIRIHGAKKWKSLGEEERRELARSKEERYWTELRTNGFKNIHLLAPKNEG